MESASHITRQLKCDNCGFTSMNPISALCPNCGGIFHSEYGSTQFHRVTVKSMWDYREYLPVDSPANIVSLGEGGTPLLQARTFGEQRVFIKNETRNPTGSQKDRGVSVAISKAKELGISRVITASTGSSGFACATYAARAGIPCVILVPADTPSTRTAAMAAHGAIVVQIPGPFTRTADVFEAVRADPTWYIAATNRQMNAYQADGTRTMAFEIFSQLDAVPDWVVVPVGSGGTLSSLWRGFNELKKSGAISSVPKMVAVQPSGYNSVEQALARNVFDRDGVSKLAAEGAGDTLMLNLRTGRKSDLADAVKAVKDSGGIAVSVSDAEALEWQFKVAGKEGIFVEPSGAAGFAGLARLLKDQRIQPSELCVVIATGSGLRQLAAVERPHRKSAPDPLTVADLNTFVRESIPS